MLKDNLPATPQPSWRSVLGVVEPLERVNPDLIDNPGLISIETQSGLQVCPVRQFVIGEDGNERLIPQVAQSWAFLRAVDEQTGRSPNSTTLFFMGPRRTSEKSWFDELADPTASNEQRLQTFGAMIETVLRAAEYEGTEIVDPRRTLGE